MNSRRLLVLLVFIACCGTVAVITFEQIQQAGAADEYLRVALESESASDWGRTEVALRSYLRLKPEDVDACRRIGKAIEAAALNEADRSRALPFYAQAVRTDPRDIESRLLLAALVYEEKPREAILHTDFVLGIDRESLEALRIQALAEAQLHAVEGESSSSPRTVWEEMIAVADRLPGDLELVEALAEFSEQVLIPSPAGRILDPVEIRREVDRRLDSLVNESGSEFEARLARLTFQYRYREPQPTAAGEELDTLIELSPENLTVRLVASGRHLQEALTTAPWKSSQIDAEGVSVLEAREHLRQAVSDHESEPIAYWSLAQLELWSGQREIAIDHLQKGVERSSHGSAILAMRLAELQLADGRWADCRRTITQFDQICDRPASGSQEEDVDLKPMASILLAQWLLAPGNPDCHPRQAIQILKVMDAETVGPSQRCLTRYLLGMAYVQLQDWAMAEREFQRCSRSTSSSPIPVAALAYVLFEQGRFREAVLQYRKSLDVAASGNVRVNEEQIWVELIRCQLGIAAQQLENERDWRLVNEGFRFLSQSETDPMILRLLEFEATQLGCIDVPRRSLASIVKKASSELQSRPDFWSMIAREAIRFGETEIAAQAIREFERLSGIRAMQLTSDLAILEGRTDEALQLLDDLRSSAGQQVAESITIRRSQLLRNAGRNDDALAELTQWARQHPDHVRVVFHLGQQAWATSNLSLLDEVIEHIEAVDGQDSVRWQICQVQKLILKYVESPSPQSLTSIERRLKQLQNRFVGDRRVWVLTAVISEYGGQTADAIRAFRMALDCGEQDPAIQLRLAALLHDDGQSREALQVCRRLLGNGEDVRVLTQAARILINGRVDPMDAELFERKFKKLATSDQSDQKVFLLMDLAVLREHQGEPEEAIRMTRDALSTRSDSIALKNNLAWFLTAYSARHDEALKIVDGILAESKTSAVMDTRAVVLIGLGRGSEAVQQLEAASDSKSRSATRWIHLAEACELTGEMDRAVMALARAEQLGLDNLTPRDRKVYMRLKIHLPVEGNS